MNLACFAAFIAIQLVCSFSLASAEKTVLILRDPSPVPPPTLEVLPNPDTKINAPVSLPESTVNTNTDAKVKVTGSSPVTVTTIPEITGTAQIAEEQKKNAETIIPSAASTLENSDSKQIEALVTSDISSQIAELETQASEIHAVNVAPNEIVTKEASTAKLPTKKTKNTEVPDEVIVHKPKPTHTNAHANSHEHTHANSHVHSHEHTPAIITTQTQPAHAQVTVVNHGKPNKGEIGHIAAIPSNPLSSPSNGGTLVLPSSESGGFGGYTYGAGSGSAEVNHADKVQGQTFIWGEAGSNLSPEITGAGGQFGAGAGAALNTDILTASLGLSLGGTTGLGYTNPAAGGHGGQGGHGSQGGHGGHSQHGGGYDGNVFGFLQQLPAPFSSFTTAGSGGYDRLQTAGKPGTPGTGRPAETNKEDAPKPPAVSTPTGLFGLLTPFSSLSSAILSGDDPEDAADSSAESGEKQQGSGEPAAAPFFGDYFPSTSGGLMGLFRPLSSLTGMTEGSVVLSGGAKVTPFLPFLNKPLCPEALEVCINACHDVGKHGGVLGHGNRCYCSCRVPDKISGGNLCSNKYTSHCNKFCKTNHVYSYESGHCNSASGHCECKCPLGQPCFGGSVDNHHNHNSDSDSDII